MAETPGRHLNRTARGQFDPMRYIFKSRSDSESGPLSLVLLLLCFSRAYGGEYFAHQVIKPREAQPLLLGGAPCLPLR